MSRRLIGRTMTDAKTSKLIAAMQSPDFYPAEEVTDVKLIETHISWVLLTGRWAYKIKKPIVNSFLDYSTLAQRLHFCQSELQLNRRWAPQIYDRVVPIYSQGGRFSLSPPGEVVEYAVRMRQFPQTALMSSMLQQHELAVPHVAKMAEELSRIHAESPVMPAEGPWGNPAQIIGDAMDNFRDLARTLPDRLRRLLEPLQAWTSARAERLRETFEHRRRAGMIRECHGDLHLGNLIWLDDQPQLFDSIEFNDAFRWIDVTNDLAFLLMDLEEHGRWDLANHLLNRYLECSGDFQGLPLVTFYKLYRALVRAKTVALAAQQHRSEFANEEIAFARSEAYLRYGLRLVLPRQPRLLIAHGLSGSGKSFGTRHLLDFPNFLRIRTDIERKRLGRERIGERGSHPFPLELYSPEMTRTVYQHCRDVAETALLAGFHVLVDGTFLKRWQRELFCNLANERNVVYGIISCAADEETLRDRIRRRAAAGNDPSDATEAVLDEQIRQIEELNGEELARRVTVTELEHDLQAAAFRLPDATEDPSGEELDHAPL